MAPGRFDRGAAEERISKLEQRTLQLNAAVFRTELCSTSDRGDKVVPETHPGWKAIRMNRVTEQLSHGGKS